MGSWGRDSAMSIQLSLQCIAYGSCFVIGDLPVVWASNMGSSICRSGTV